MPSSEWLLAEQAAERVGRSERTIREWGATGRVRRMRPGRLWWYFVPDLLRADKETITRTRVSQD
jgi:hypothetical protein